MTAAQLINQTSGDVEYYTPAFIVEAAREVLGGRIELDPASCDFANQTVKARRIFTDPGLEQVGELIGLIPVPKGEPEQQGPRPLMRALPGGAFEQAWEADTLWMNHPFRQRESKCKHGCKKMICLKRGYHLAHNREGNEDWIERVVRAHESGRVRCGMCITFAATSERWFRPLFGYLQCFLSPRTNYVGRNGHPVAGVTKGSVVTLLKESDFGLFRDVFHNKLGVVK